MCIIIAKPANINLKNKVLENCFEHNPDGAGFMYSEGGALVVQKGFFTIDKLIDAFTPHKSKPAVLHFRIKTHGAIDEANCHPFNITSTLAFAHNGIIQKTASFSKEYSDTHVFNERYMKHFVSIYGKKIIKDEKFKKMVEEFIGYSKLAFLDAKGNIEIYNETLGTKKDGVWFSNTSYQTRKVYTPPSSGGGYTSHGTHWPTTGNKDSGNVRSLPAPNPSTVEKDGKLSSMGRVYNYTTNQWEEFREVAGRRIEKGDLVEFTSDFDTSRWQFKKEDLAEVIAFGTGYNLWVRPVGLTEKDAPEALIPMWKIRQYVSADELDNLAGISGNKLN